MRTYGTPGRHLWYYNGYQDHSLRTAAVDNMVKTNVLGFGDYILCDIQWYISNDQAYHKLWNKRD